MLCYSNNALCLSFIPPHKLKRVLQICVIKPRRLFRSRVISPVVKLRVNSNKVASTQRTVMCKILDASSLLANCALHQSRLAIFFWALTPRFTYQNIIDIQIVSNKESCYVGYVERILCFVFMRKTSA